MSASGAVADWQLSASAVIIGNGKNWGGSRHYPLGYQMSDFDH